MSDLKSKRKTDFPNGSQTPEMPAPQGTNQETSLYDRRIQLHPACLMYPRLSDNALTELERDMFDEDGTVNLRQRILIDEEGRIVDGRHRAIVLIKNGHGDFLCEQIQACLGALMLGEMPESDWVTCLSTDADPYETARSLQIGRRNLPDYMIARSKLPEYQQAVERSPKGRRRKSDVQRAAISPVKEFCKGFKIDPRVFQMVRKVESFAPELWEQIQHGDIAFADAYQIAASRDEQKSKSNSKSKKSNRRNKPRESKKQLALFDPMDQPFTMRDLLDEKLRMEFCDLALRVLSEEALADLAILETVSETNAKTDGEKI